MTPAGLTPDTRAFVTGDVPAGFLDGREPDSEAWIAGSGRVRAVARQAGPTAAETKTTAEGHAPMSRNEAKRLKSLEAGTGIEPVYSDLQSGA